MSTWRELTFLNSSLKDAVLVIEDERANVLADPLRWRILEILGAGKSVAEISQTLDVTDARVLYHLQRLAQTGVVHLEEEGADPQEWRCLPAAGAIRVRETRATGEQIAEAMPTDVVSQFNQASREAAEGLYGSTFQMSVNHNRARLSEEQAAEFGRRLLALIEEYFPPGKGDRSGIKYGFYGILTPIDLHPLGDSETEE
ncbi:MAG: helix-turn-helix domain-containing protein [Gemmatimonadetes bacterium]|nr:helix-turn-helix domain-containing protein [Gemmatimonadota bacterium]MYC74090.1 helix-turn-helix domain-containing protein [Gemmatimonadota bacterium]MYI63576.1 helix-turn-helix domain-containing protein [Gemmatimonadota bacterium]